MFENTKNVLTIMMLVIEVRLVVEEEKVKKRKRRS